MQMSRDEMILVHQIIGNVIPVSFEKANVLRLLKVIEEEDSITHRRNNSRFRCLLCNVWNIGNIQEANVLYSLVYTNPI